MKRPIFLWLFFLASIIHLYFEWTAYTPGILIIKPSLISFLLLHFWTQVSPRKGWVSWLAFGLIFSIGGDSLLMLVEQSWGGELFFVLGLGSFLVTHLFYSMAFWTAGGKQVVYQGARWLWFALFSVYLILFYWTLYPGMEPTLQIPVALYSLCIVTMVLLALQLRWIFPGQATNTIFWGAILFMLSDSMIGLNKFTSLPIPIAWVRVGIMLTYLAGQWLVVRGSLQLRKKTN